MIGKFGRVSKLIFFNFLILSSFACRQDPGLNTVTPQYILWAWERPENLEFIDSSKFGVAFLAQTLILQNDQVIYNPRRQPLKVSPETKIIAVTRIETGKRSENKAALTDSQINQVSDYVLKTVEMKNVSTIQIDFDAAVSERDFYRKLLQNLRQSLPKNYPLSMTALASFCMSDNWITDLPVDEVVPMIFRMGPDDNVVKNYLLNGNDFRNPRCQTSYGIAADEPIIANFPNSRRIYFFNVHSWSKNDVESLKLPESN